MKGHITIHTSKINRIGLEIEDMNLLVINQYPKTIIVFTMLVLNF